MQPTTHVCASFAAAASGQSTSVGTLLQILSDSGTEVRRWLQHGDTLYAERLCSNDSAVLAAIAAEAAAAAAAAPPAIAEGKVTSSAATSLMSRPTERTCMAFIVVSLLVSVRAAR